MSRPYGVGLAYRSCLHEHVMRHRQALDVLEIPTEDYIIRRRRLESDPYGRLLRELKENFGCVAHGISLSVGSVEPQDQVYLRDTLRFLQEFELDVFSEHLTFHRMDGNDIAIFLAMPWEESTLHWLRDSYRATSQYLGRPFALENVSYSFPIPCPAMDEAEFLCRLTELTDCSLLLDVTNVYNNAHNHSFDAAEFIKRLPGERVSQLHLAGGHFDNGRWLDSHSEPVMDGVWELLDVTLEHTAAEMVILERDSNFGDFDGDILQDILRARECFYRHRPQQPAESSSESQPAERQAREPSQLEAELPEYQDLRHFQQALMRQITDDDFRRKSYADLSVAAKRFDLPEVWQERLRQCDREQIDVLANKWKAVQRDNSVDEQRYRQLEWRAWAEQQ